jgi:hypothetical protein
MPTLSTADTLTAAAQKLQHSAEHGDLWILASSGQHAIAEWLETEAASNAGDEDHTGCTPDTCATVAALALARQLLGGES